MTTKTEQSTRSSHTPHDWTEIAAAKIYKYVLDCEHDHPGELAEWLNPEQLSVYVEQFSPHAQLVEALEAHQLVTELEATENPKDVIRLLEAAGDWDSGWKTREEAIEHWKVEAARLTEAALSAAKE